MNNMPWINSYPAGVRWDADITPAPLQTILDNTVAKWPDRPAIDFMGKRLSYREPITSSKAGGLIGNRQRRF